jgi:hypothetical protein
MDLSYDSGVASMGILLARHTAHQAIHTTAVALARGLRIAAHSVGRGEAKLASRTSREDE